MVFAVPPISRVQERRWSRLGAPDMEPDWPGVEGEIARLENGEVGCVCPIVERLDDGRISAAPASDILNFCLLFFDRVVWPRNSLINMEGVAGIWLSQGLVESPKIRLQGAIGDSSMAFQFALLEMAKLLDERESGRWPVVRGAGFPDPTSMSPMRYNCAVAAIKNALILPANDTDLESVLNFKERRKDELNRLRSHIESFSAFDADADGRVDDALFELESALNDFMKVSREPNWRKVVSNLEWSFDWTAPAKGLPGLIALNQVSGTLAAVGAGLMSAFSLSSSVKWRGKRDRSPFDYLVSIEKTL